MLSIQRLSIVNQFCVRSLENFAMKLSHLRLFCRKLECTAKFCMLSLDHLGVLLNSDLPVTIRIVCSALSGCNVYLLHIDFEFSVRPYSATSLQIMFAFLKIRQDWNCEDCLGFYRRKILCIKGRSWCRRKTMDRFFIGGYLFMIPS